MRELGRFSGVSTDDETDGALEQILAGGSRRLARGLSRVAASFPSAPRAMVRPGLLIALLLGLAPLYLIAIQPELHASGDTGNETDAPALSATFSLVNITACVTTTAGTDLVCPVTYTAGNSLVLNVTLDTGNLVFETPQSVSDGVNSWIADTLSGGVTCQSDNNSGGSDCYYHANASVGLRKWSENGEQASRR